MKNISYTMNIISIYSQEVSGLGFGYIPNSNSKEKVRDHILSKVGSSKVFIIWLLQASTVLK